MLYGVNPGLDGQLDAGDAMSMRRHHATVSPSPFCKSPDLVEADLGRTGTVPGFSHLRSGAP